MRTALGSSLLLLALSGLVALPATADAATICAAPDTTWVGPATADGDRSWAVASNWSNGVPTATSAVCVPGGTTADPQVTAGTTVTVAAVDASAAGVDVSGGSLTVTGPWDAGRLHASGGEVVLGGTSVLHEVVLQASADLVVAGAAALAADADVDAFEAAPEGGVRVTSTGELTLDDDAYVRVSGVIVNHGVVRAQQGHLDLMGIGVQYAPPGAASDGRYIGRPGADLWLSGTVLADGAVLDGVIAFDVHVPADAEVTATGGARLWPDIMDQDVPGITGSGTVLMTGGSVLATGLADHLTLRVPQGELAQLDGWIGGHAHAVVDGTATDKFGGLAVYDDAKLEVTSTGVLRMTHDQSYGGPERYGPFSSFVVHEGGTLVGGGTEGSVLFGALENHGTVRAEGGDLWILGSSKVVVDGVLTGGRWEVGAGSELAFADDPDLGTLVEAITGNAAHVVLEGAGSSIHGLEALTDIKAGAALELGSGASLSGTASLVNHGDVALENTAELTTTGSFDNAGSLSVHGSASVEPEAGFTNSVALTLDPDATLDVPGDLLSTGDLWLGDGSSLDLSGAFLNQGDVHVADASASINPASGTDNDGNLLVGADGALALAGTLTSSGTVSQGAAADLSTSGAFTNHGGLELGASATLDVTGNLHSDGTISLGDGADVDLTGAFQNDGDVDVADAVASISPATGTGNTGNLLLGPDGSLDLTGAVTSSGTVSLATGASLSATGPLLNDGEVLALGAGDLLAPDGFTNHARVDVDPAASLAVAGDLVSDGILAVPADATLTTTGDLLNVGRLQVGATGRVEPGGAFTQEATGLLRINVTDTGSGRVAADGVRDLAGTLVLRPETNAWPPLGTRRALVTSAGRVTADDAFDVVRAPRRSGLTAAVRYRDNRVWVRVVDASA